ncbi:MULTISPECIES: acyl carrier protein [Mesorhizobium]|uniref:acyl carrier protein n=1 Tax=Mesorhizobium TaxID=68287 RepID=UPI0007FFAB89|nr:MULTISPECIES: acyl carrier protein [Mesorhizobium]MUT22881.1 nodulation protein NodF [Mesorhizobium japonicum]OBQ96931.1 nodulation protein NodF [Mesorhizobium sp. AA23]PBB29304.1 nodulation protein NodF [Mesorhizobium sp. WSM3882]PBB31652.1 nodulation protein NodF [Mesorhizobium sp. WSM3868]PBB40497.1 nodulation protein NodF [Mesorhizobium sp. WSM3866]
MTDQLTTEIIAIIKKRVESENGEGTKLSVGEITTTTELTGLGIDSLGLADVLWDLEQAYGIKIEMNSAEAWSGVQNVGGIVEAIRSLLAKAA